MDESIIIPLATCFCLESVLDVDRRRSNKDVSARPQGHRHNEERPLHNKNTPPAWQIDT